MYVRVVRPSEPGHVHGRKAFAPLWLITVIGGGNICEHMFSKFPHFKLQPQVLGHNHIAPFKIMCTPLCSQRSTRLHLQLPLTLIARRLFPGTSRIWPGSTSEKPAEQCTVGWDEKFQIPRQKNIFEISGPGPSYTSLGTSQVHIWSYFEQLCWGAQVQCGGAGENGLFWGISD